MERITGDTLDIRYLIYFDCYQPVNYLDPATFPETKEKLIRKNRPC